MGSGPRPGMDSGSGINVLILDSVMVRIRIVLCVRLAAGGIGWGDVLLEMGSPARDASREVDC